MKKEIEICIEIGQLVCLKLHNGQKKRFIFKTSEGLKNFRRVVKNCNYSIQFLDNKIQLIDLDAEILYSLKVIYIY